MKTKTVRVTATVQALNDAAVDLQSAADEYLRFSRPRRGTTAIARVLLIQRAGRLQEIIVQLKTTP